MEKEFIEKCEEIFEKRTLTAITEDDLIRWENITGFSLNEELKYIISNHSTVFLRDGLDVYSEDKSPVADEEGTEPFMFFLGFKGRDTLFSVYETYKDQIEKDIYPIALADGGDLWCIDENGRIFLWLHDEPDNNAYEIFDSVAEMIFSIREVTYREEPSGVIEEESWLPDDFFAALEK